MRCFAQIDAAAQNASLNRNAKISVTLPPSSDLIIATRNIDVSEFRVEYDEPSEFMLAESAIAALKDSGLPQILFECWKEYGFSKYLHGYFQLVNPLDYEQVVAEWIKASPFEGADRFSRSAWMLSESCASGA